MRTSLLNIALALVGTLVAPASELSITSFDLTGRLSFQGLPTAASYQVQWSTNLSSPVWNLSPPGIGVIPATGASSLTVTVGVVHASCFYRVVAEVTNVPPTGLTNAFNLTSEGWLVVSYPFRSHVPNPATAALPYDGAFGNPPGSVRIGDVFPETGLAAPLEYLGNKLSFYGGSLAYDIFIRYTDGVVYPAVILNGGNLSLYYDTPSPPVNAWQRKTIPLSEAGWKVSGTGEPATQAVFTAVISNLVGIYIYTEWHTGEDDTNVDGISLTVP
jgi:hypothetical protein